MKPTKNYWRQAYQRMTLRQICYTLWERHTATEDQKWSWQVADQCTIYASNSQSSKVRNLWVWIMYYLYKDTWHYFCQFLDKLMIKKYMQRQFYGIQIVEEFKLMQQMDADGMNKIISSMREILDAFILMNHVEEETKVRRSNTI